MSDNQRIIWTAEMDRTIADLWAAGHSMMHIAGVLRLSDSTVGRRKKALKLPAQVRTPGIQPSHGRVAREGAVFLALARSLPGRAPVQAPVPLPTLPRVPTPRRGEPCNFIVSGDGRHALRCDKPGLPGKPYCAAHHAVCTVRLSIPPVFTPHHALDRQCGVNAPADAGALATP